MRSSVVIACVVIAACSNNGAKREDGSTMPPPKPDPVQPVTKTPKVYLSTPGGEVAVNVEIVATWPKIEKGLMFREHLPPDDGMLFFMGYEHDHAFYMRNTLIPLDMIFIKKDLTVAGISELAEPRTETLRKVGVPSLYVLEVNGGYTRAHGVIAGAKVRFEGMQP
ncbi:hypothetical protein BH11MYX3_BH11MYX3_17820 [soil metagenome]